MQKNLVESSGVLRWALDCLSWGLRCNVRVSDPAAAETRSDGPVTLSLTRRWLPLYWLRLSICRSWHAERVQVVFGAPLCSDPHRFNTVDATIGFARNVCRLILSSYIYCRCACLGHARAASLQLNLR